MNWSSYTIPNLTPKSDLDHGADQARARAQVYQLLARAFTQLPDERLLTVLASWASGLQASSVSRELPEDMRKSLLSLGGLLTSGPPLSWMAESAAVEFTKLFRGVKPGYSPLPPYESLYRGESNSVFGEATSGVRQEYRRFGFAPGDVIGNEPPDHIGFELEFLHLLCKLEAGAWDSENMDEVQRFRSAQNEFLTGHLLVWVPKFCDEVVARDSFGLFSALARFTRSWLNLETEQHLAADEE